MVLAGEPTGTVTTTQQRTYDANERLVAVVFDDGTTVDNHAFIWDRTGGTVADIVQHANGTTSSFL